VAHTEIAKRGQPENEERHRQEWRWLRRATLGGTLLGALILWSVAYATGDDSSALFSRGDVAFLAAIAGALAGLIVGFMLWALWVLLRPLGWRFSQR